MRVLVFERSAFDDLMWWTKRDAKTALRIMRLTQNVLEDPFRGIGKPEPLRGNLRGCWSRRITAEHRLVYEVFEDKIRILSCRRHY